MVEDEGDSLGRQPMVIQATTDAATPVRSRLGRSGWQRFLRDPAGILSLLILLALLVTSFAASGLPLADPIEQIVGEELIAPNQRFWFGTDDLGRDLFSRCIYGMRLSFSIGLLAVMIAGGFGVTLGMLQGYFKGRIDNVLGRLWDTIIAFPGLLLGLAVAVFLGEGSHIAAIAAALNNTPEIARLARALVFTEQEKDYTAAAKSNGASTRRIIFLHLLPNIFPVLTVQFTLTMSEAMIVEAGLSFLGLGAQPPEPSLGSMLRDARNYMNDGLWYALFPGAILALLLLQITFLADALADAFDPRRRMGSEL